MFNDDFYPTPRKVVEEMLKDEQIVGSVILEPSAGKGNILKVLKEQGAMEVLTCEIIEEFQPYLKENSRFIKPDFLKVNANEIAHVDYIIMNPPFNKAIEHIEHAFNIAPPGCTIISLNNQSNIDEEKIYGWHGDYSDEEKNKIKRKNKRREKLIHLIKNYGFSEQMYNCFSDAERKTNIDIAKIILFKDGKEDQVDFGVYMNFEFDDDSEQAGLMPYNEVRECVNRYVGAVNRFNNMMDIVKEMNDLTKPFNNYDNTQLTIDMKDKHGLINLGQYKKELQKAAWQWIFQKLNMDKFQTTKLREQMDRYIELKSKYPFTVKNIYNVLDMIIQTHRERMQSTLVEAFDLICGYSDQNKTYYEGWKTNSAYKVNKKFIIPYICEGYEWDKKPKPYVNLDRIYSDGVNKINDIYKALCHMTGSNYDHIITPRYFIHYNNLEWGKWYTVGFFRIKGYKKGTMHFQFIDDKIWETFNRQVAELKGWQLPEKTDNKTKGTERTKSKDVEIFSDRVNFQQQEIIWDG
jgi:predicted RNA methylase